MSSLYVMCPRASAFYVPGLGGSNPDDFKIPFRQLLESVFGLHYGPKKKQILPNACRFAVNDDKELLSSIKTIAQEHDYCDMVSLVWFAHSHGAKMICEAYKQLQGSPQFPKIKKGSAIICIGGASLATDEMARVVLNVEYKNDYIAKGAANLIGDRDSHLLKVGPYVKGSCLCCDEDSPQHEPQFKKSNKSAKGMSFGISTAFKGASTSAAASSTSSADGEEKAHYIGEYLTCKVWRRRVQQMLPLAPRCEVHS